MASRHKKGRRWKVVAVFVAAVALLVAGYFSYPYLQKYYKRFFGSGEEAEMGAVVPMQTYRQMYPQYNLFGIPFCSIIRDFLKLYTRASAEITGI